MLANYEHESIQAHNIDDALLARGIESKADNRLHQFYDRNADVGGPLKRDRVWWYTSFRDERSQARYANFPVRPFETRLINYTGKLTVQLSPNDKLIAYGQAGKKLQPYRQDTATIGGPGGSRSFGLFDNEDATANQDYIGWVWKGEYNRVLSSDTLVEMRAGRVGYTWDSGVYSDEVRREDIGSRLVTGGNVKWIENVNRNQLLGTVQHVPQRVGWHAQPQDRLRDLSRYAGARSSRVSAEPAARVQQRRRRRGAAVHPVVFDQPPVRRRLLRHRFVAASARG